MNLTKKTAIISGGASGLGAATARRLVQNGSNVILVDIDEDLGGSLARELGGQAAFIKTDITDSHQVEAAVQATVAKFGQIDIAVNCAGLTTGMKVAGKKSPHDLNLFKKIINTNLIGLFDLVRQVAVAMIGNKSNEEGGKGVIINTASIAAFDGQMGQAAYAASKAAIVGMTLPLARDLAEHGIRVCSIAPGLFDTPMMAKLPEQVRVTMGNTVPFPSRLGNPQEFAMLVQHIIGNPMLNGETIRLDGAVRMPPR